MSYEFAGCLYRTQHDLLLAIAAEWITGGGSWRGAAALANIADESDEHLADECIAGWELDTTWDSETSQMNRWDITREDLIEAMSEYREDLIEAMIECRERRGTGAEDDSDG